MLTLLIILATTQIDVHAIEYDVSSHGLSWTPGDTQFTAMTKDERSRYLMREAPTPKIHRSAIVSAEPMTLPDAWDWMDFQTPVKDQGPCGSCWAFSTLAATESAYMVALDDPALTIDLSEQFAVSCLPGGCGGGLIEPVLRQLELDGIPDEACFPYSGRDFTACVARCEDWKGRTFRIVDWAWVIPTSSDEMRAALMRGPVVTAMVVYSDLWSYTGGVYEHVTGEAEGFHAVTLVGWKGDAWIAKNSWGSSWGESGYFRIRQNQSGIASYGVQVYVRVEDVPEVTRSMVTGCGCGMVY